MLSTISVSGPCANPEAIYRKDLLLRVDEREGDDVATMSINEDFATQLEAVTQIENMLPEPSKIRQGVATLMREPQEPRRLDDLDGSPLRDSQFMCLQLPTHIAQHTQLFLTHDLANKTHSNYT